MIVFKLEAFGYDDVLKHQQSRTSTLRTVLRDAVREETRLLVQELRALAPKKTGAFAAGIGYRTDERPEGVTATVFVGGPHAFLLPIITEGTPIHPIAAKNVQALHFLWPGGPPELASPPGSEWYFFKAVTHPGTKPNPFVFNAQLRRAPFLEYNLRVVAKKVAYLEG